MGFLEVRRDAQLGGSKGVGDGQGGLACYDSWGRTESDMTEVPLLIATGEAIPLRGLEGVPSLPGAPQDEAGLTRKFDSRP